VNLLTCQPESDSDTLLKADVREYYMSLAGSSTLETFNSYVECLNFLTSSMWGTLLEAFGLELC